MCQTDVNSVNNLFLDNSFDPLDTSSYDDLTDVALRAKKRTIKNVLNCYVGWYDPFCEMIQNALDAVDKIGKLPGYEPKIQIIIDLRDNSLTVVDNGIGFKNDQFKTFIAPNYSFKDGDVRLRGRKGVGATYLAYGFNYLRVITKNDQFSANYIMRNGKHWASSEEVNNRPQMEVDSSPIDNEFFENEHHGTLMSIKCDAESFPADLSWMGITDAENWMRILRVKTALGSVESASNALITIDCYDREGNHTQNQLKGTKYLTINGLVNKAADLDDILNWIHSRRENYRETNTIPTRLRNLDGFYGSWDAETLIDKIRVLDDDDIQAIHRYNISTIFGYVYSTKTWDQIDSMCDMRKGQHLLYGGIQMAVNNMPQGELIQIPLTKNIGRQKQANILFHFENCEVDMGRKGFEKTVVDLAKKLAQKLMSGVFNEAKPFLKTNTGANPDLVRELELTQWKEEMVRHQEESPLVIDNPHFFNPVNEVAVLSTPTREQDVIALFNQLLAGGVIRGIKIMSTNERLTYDGLFRIVIKRDALHEFNKDTNPLGITESTLDDFLSDKNEFISSPQVIEYKFSLDGLVEDFGNGNKNMSDINLVVAWEAGEQYRENYVINSLLLDGDETIRQYHGITHHLYTSDGQLVCFVILLKDLIMKLNSDEGFSELQASYDND